MPFTPFAENPNFIGASVPRASAVFFMTTNLLTLSNDISTGVEVEDTAMDAVKYGIELT